MANFYYPGYCQNMRFQSEQAYSYESDEEDLVFEDEKEDRIDMSGFMESREDDIPYETIFKYFDSSLNFKKINNSLTVGICLILNGKLQIKVGKCFW